MQQLYEAQKNPTLLIIGWEISFSSSKNVSTLEKELKVIPNIYDSKVSALCLRFMNCFTLLQIEFCCFNQCSWSNYRYYPELLLFYTIRVHSVALAFLNLISYESLVLLDERYPTLKHYLFTVNITYAFLLFFMLSSIWQGRDANGLNILHKWRN